MPDSIRPAGERSYGNRPAKPRGPYRWYSVCSMHCVYDGGCRICQCGHWVNEPGAVVSRAIFRASPRLWRWWVNR
jgi:hypothetical protein